MLKRDSTIVDEVEASRILKVNEVQEGPDDTVEDQENMIGIGKCFY